MKRNMLVLGLGLTLLMGGCSSKEEKLFVQADEYMQKAEYEQAKKTYLTIIEENEKMPDAYIKLADLYINEQEYKQAENLLEKGILSVKKTEELQKKLAQVFYYNGDYKKSEEQWKELLETKLYLDAYEGLGNIYYFADEYEKSVNLMEQAMDKHSKSPAVYAIAARMYAQNDEMKKAAEALGRGFEEDVNDEELYESLEYLTNVDWESVKETGEDLLNENEKSRAGMVFSFYGYFFEKEFEEALDVISPIAGKIKNDHVRLMAALSFHFNGDEEKAQKMVDDINIKNTDDLQILHEIVYYYETTGNQKAAIAAAEKIANMHTDAYDLYWWLYEQTNDEAYLQKMGLINWSAETEKEDDLIVALSNDEHLYTGTRITEGDYWSEDFESEIKYYEIKDGKVSWTYKEEAFASEQLFQSPTGKQYYHELIDESIYAPLVAIDETKKAWTNDDVITNPAFSKDGTIYVGTLKGEEGFLQALNENNDVQWEVPITVPNNPIVGEDGTIYTSTYLHEMEWVGTMEDGGMYAINPDGSIKWKSEESGVYSEPVIGPDGTVYVSKWNSEDNQSVVYGFSNNGEKIFEYEINTYATKPVVTEDFILIKNDEVLEAVSPKGKKKWEIWMESSYADLHPQKNGSILYTTNGVDDEPLIGLINKEGEQVWTASLSETGDSSSEEASYTYVNSLVVGEEGIFALTNTGDEQTTLWALRKDGQKMWMQNYGGSRGSIALKNEEVILTMENKVYGLNQSFMISHKIYPQTNPFEFLLY